MALVKEETMIIHQSRRQWTPITRTRLRVHFCLYDVAVRSVAVFRTALNTGNHLLRNEERLLIQISLPIPFLLLLPVHHGHIGNLRPHLLQLGLNLGLELIFGKPIYFSNTELALDLQAAEVGEQHEGRPRRGGRIPLPGLRVHGLVRRKGPSEFHFKDLGGWAFRQLRTGTPPGGRRDPAQRGQRRGRRRGRRRGPPRSPAVPATARHGPAPVAEHPQQHIRLGQMPPRRSIRARGLAPPPIPGGRRAAAPSPR